MLGEMNEQGDPITFTEAPPGSATLIRWCDGDHRVIVNAHAERAVRAFLDFWADYLIAVRSHAAAAHGGARTVLIPHPIPLEDTL